MNYIWAMMMIISIFCAFTTGRMSILSNSILTGAGKAIELVISLLGVMALWTGLMTVAEKSGITNLLAKLFYPILKIIFPEYKKDSKVSKAISMNITANLLGLGNASTPFGLNAIKEMSKLNGNSNTANNSMVMFVVINTACLQLIPTSLLILRQKYGSHNPFDILPLLWMISITALTIGIIAAKISERFGKKNDK